MFKANRSSCIFYHVSMWVALIIILQLISTSYSYVFKQQMLVIESNQLLSGSYVRASSSVNRSWKHHIDSDIFHVSALIYETSDNQVRSIYSTGFDKLTIPTYEGSSFVENDSKNALIGSKVPSSLKDGREVITLFSTDYEVIGRLGSSADSPLSNTTLLNDSSYLESEYITLYFDGPNICEIEWLEGEKGNVLGLERMFDVTRLSKFIKCILLSVVYISTFMWCYLFSNLTMNRNIVSHAMGLSPVKLLLKNALTIHASFVASAALVLTNGYPSSVHKMILTQFVILDLLSSIYYLHRFFKTVGG